MLTLGIIFLALYIGHCYIRNVAESKSSKDESGVLRKFLRRITAVTSNPGSVHCLLKYILTIKNSDRDFKNVTINLCS